MSDIAIKVENLSKKYEIGRSRSGSLRESLSDVWHKTFGGQRNDVEAFWALRDVSFEIKQGEAVGIIGRNGAGKSTLLKLLSKITYPTSGKITMNGRVSSLLEVGTGFHPELTGRENIYLNGTILGMSRKEVKSKFDEIVAFSGVEKFLDTPVKRYSSGMYVRLAFAVAAHLEPEILIIDEVLAVGDAEFQKKCLGKMDEVAKGGRTVLFVSHNMAAIETLCQTGVLLIKGEMLFLGSIENTLSKYKDSTQSIVSDIKTGKGTFDLLRHSKEASDQKRQMLTVRTFCNNQLSDVFYGGCNFRFDIEVFNNETYENLLFGFVIKSSDGTPLIGINNRHTGAFFNVPKNKKQIFRVVLSSFPIYRNGIYSVDLYWGNHNTSYEIIYDAFTFEVDRADVFKTAILLDSKLNLIFTEHVNLIISEA
ncbi:MAG: ABC transporter ATP-binding protein [Salinivirgaceae bacterium]